MTRLEELRDKVKKGPYNCPGAEHEAVIELLAIEIERAKDDEFVASAVDYPMTDPPKHKLLSCPACGGDAVIDACDTYVRCVSVECDMNGPVDDPTGEKWNALPRQCGAWDELSIGKGIQEERERWIKAVRIERDAWIPDSEQRKLLDASLRRMGVRDDT